jgi:uncharacterized protein YdhG (YjbR/CyaY superfamily)
MNKNLEYKTIDQYISTFPIETQDLLQAVRKVIKEIVPDATEAISYKMPTFKLNGKNLVHFAGYDKHIGFYPVPSGIEAFRDEFIKNGYKFAKGSVQFPLDRPLPIDLIKRIVRFRLEESSK